MIWILVFCILGLLACLYYINGWTFLGYWNVAFPTYHEPNPDKEFRVQVTTSYRSSRSYFYHIRYKYGYVWHTLMDYSAYRFGGYDILDGWSRWVTGSEKTAVSMAKQFKTIEDINAYYANECDFRDRHLKARDENDSKFAERPTTIEIND